MTVFNVGDIVKIKSPLWDEDSHLPVTDNSICKIVEILPVYGYTYPYRCELLFGATKAEDANIAFAEHEMEKLTCKKRITCSSKPGGTIPAF